MYKAINVTKEVESALTELKQAYYTKNNPNPYINKLKELGYVYIDGTLYGELDEEITVSREELLELISSAVDNIGYSNVSKKLRDFLGLED